MKRKLTLIILLMMPLACSNGLNDLVDNLGRDVPICVNSATGNDSSDGRGWANAYQTIQAAVDNAGPGDEIWVAGTFTIATNLTIDEKVSLYGGFNGTESERDERDLNNKTVINGTGHIILQADGLSMDGFKFTGPRSSEALGLAAGHSYILKNCEFVSNNTVINGSAIRCTSGTVKLVDCSFAANKGSSGGAIWCSGGTIIINGCTFDANYTTSGSGGAIYCENSSTIEITDTTFTGNNTQNGGVVGGAIYCKGSSLIITGSTFDSNNAGGSGGAIYAEASTDPPYTPSCIQINETTFNNNTTSSNYYGGAICCTASTVKVSECKFNANTAGNSGGAIYNGLPGNEDDDNNNLEITESEFKSNTCIAGNGGAIASDNSKLVVKNSIFNGNTAFSPGGAVYILGEDGSESPCIIANSLFANNQCTDTGGWWAGGIYALPFDPSTLPPDTPEFYVLNCTFYNNTVYGTAKGSGSIYLMPGVEVHVYNSIFYLNEGSYSVQGAVNAEGSNNAWDNAWDKGEDCPDSVTLTSPPFVSTTSGSEDFRLAAGSNCIDAGCPVNITGFTIPSTDLAGNPRIVGTIDIGAYERQ